MKLKIVNKSGNPLKFNHEGDSGKNVSAWFGDNPESLKLFTCVRSEVFYATPVTKDYYGNNYVTLQAGHRIQIPTGIFIEIPKGYEIQVRPRSGKSFKKGLNVILGTIDSNYRGEIKVIAHNISNEAFTITEGEEIAQIVLWPVVHDWETDEVETLSNTTRGEGGFGSTDVAVGCKDCGEEL